jgi:threonine synthase
MLFGCPKCLERGLECSLEVRYELQLGVPPLMSAARSSIWDFVSLLPVREPRARTSLGEGWSPLVPAPTLLDAADGVQPFVKFEATNPTGSFKDRLNAVNVSAARSFGYGRVLCTTTGNHGVSLAAYAAAGGLECLVACQAEVEPLAVRQMRLYGARVITLDGPAAEAREYLARLVREEHWWPSVRNHPRPYANPFGMEGYKTIAFEIYLQLGRLPDWVLVPSGGGDSVAGIAKGFRELQSLGLTDCVPGVVACQAEASAPLVHAWTRGRSTVTAVTPDSSIAISVLEDRTGDHALRALIARNGMAVAVSEQQIQRAIHLLGRAGLCVEPASAVSAAGFIELQRRGTIRDQQLAVCVATATGLRWPATFGQLDPCPERVDVTSALRQRNTHSRREARDPKEDCRTK